MSVTSIIGGVVVQRPSGRYDQSADDINLFIHSMVSVNRNIVGYNIDALIITVVVVFVSHFHSYCDFVRTL